MDTELIIKRPALKGKAVFSQSGLILEVSSETITKLFLIQPPRFELTLSNNEAHENILRGKPVKLHTLILLRYRGKFNSLAPQEKDTKTDFTGFSRKITV